MKFSEEDKLLLLQVAKDSIYECIENETSFRPLSALDYPPLNMLAGAFVSVYHSQKLRGCLGRFQSAKPLYLLIANLAASAATKDYRFNPISKEELEKVSVEISVLSALHKIESTDEIMVGKHGIYIKHGSHCGTLLPQVATKQGWDKIQMLEFCAKHKTGIGKHDWKEAELFTYEALVFDNK